MLPYYRNIKKETNLISYWRLNDFEGSTIAIDWADTYNLNGKYNKITSLSPALIVEEGAGSHKFGLTEQNVEIPYAPPLAPAIAAFGFTVEAWVLPTEAAQTSAIISRQNAAFTHPNKYYLGLSSGKLTGSVGNGATIFSVTASAALPVGRPSLVAVTSIITAEQGYLNLYVDGINIGEENFPALTNNPEEVAVFIGALGNNTKRFQGLISEVAIYEVPLAQYRLENHFKLGRQIESEQAYIRGFEQPVYE